MNITIAVWYGVGAYYPLVKPRANIKQLALYPCGVMVRRGGDFDSTKKVRPYVLQTTPHTGGALVYG